ncbi:Nitrilotriacetate monooxygenase component B [Caballeronia sordidicola]|uniref:Nitrilotriacetate monooxygenase component B n=1 Tax=Caballeronia sordidicola TaxID=196367 RepID=A0A226X7N7_CABSO|nr:Nitrilotriacetate monooxygenase component B [Caballeronia sordidicola]
MRARKSSGKNCRANSELHPVFGIDHVTFQHCRQTFELSRIARALRVRYTVIASHVDGEPIGLTCQSFYSVSTSPPPVSLSVMSSSASYPKIRESGRFVVNILSDEQVRISNQLA